MSRPGPGSLCETALRELVGDCEAPLALAVSGGGDSTALLHMIAAACRGQRKLVCFTVDHGLRDAAREEAAFVASACRRLGVMHRRLAWKQPRARQAEARKARHRLLAAAAREAGAGHLLTGHTRDDQDETFLMRARQGSGWFGLAGMDPLALSPAWPEGREVRVVRPLLGVSRAGLRDWLREQGHDWRDDPSNDDPAYERVRMRRLLDAAPGLAGRVRASREKLETLRRAELGRLSRLISSRVRARADGSVWLDPRHVPPETCQRLLGALIQVAAGHARAPRGDGLRALTREIVAGGPQRPGTLAGAWIARQGAAVMLARDPGLVPSPPLSGDTVWDGRFVRAPGQSPPAPETAMSRRGLPPEPAGWCALAGQRLEEMSNCWQILSRL
ncbi:MAG: tRNA lysidine(34) synthetase TilS [Alphaproteobacteria bacterium]|nr:tRNA lysidine(34) synthetase TilS [Alphaproteobacteria bacterium]